MLRGAFGGRAVGSGALLESAIAVTVIGAGMLLAFGRRWSLASTTVLAAVLALIHGFAHGAEGPGHSGSYIVGLMLTTGALSITASIAAAQLRRRMGWLRAAGVASAATGLVTLVA